MIMDKKTLRDVDVKGKKVLVRVDFNVPVGKSGDITDDSRIRASLPTISYLLQNGAAIILVSHFGRPKGKVAPEFSLAPMAAQLAKLLSRPVPIAPSVVGPDAKNMAAALKPGELLMLENVRFHPGEEMNDPGLAKDLSSLADVFVNDAFGAAHRAHSSTAGVAAYLPAVAGLLMEKEITSLGSLISNPERPFVTILGGAKVADKLPVLTNLVHKVDALLIGGGVAQTFLAANGIHMGASPIEGDMMDDARKVLEVSRTRGIHLELPVDVIAADAFSETAHTQVVRRGDVPEGWLVLDIGPQTTASFIEHIKKARTVFWNGPLGVFEMAPFRAGTDAVAQALADSPAMTVVGGGDSLAALEQAGVASRIKYLSTGGGASLEFLEGRELPGVAALADRRQCSARARE
jgi:phosphoglycerate kinase